MNEKEQQDYDRKWKSNFEREMGKLTDAVNSMLIQISVTQERLEQFARVQAEHAIKIDEVSGNTNKVKGGFIALAAAGGVLTWLGTQWEHVKAVFR